MPESYCTHEKKEAICIDCLQQSLVDWRPLKSLFFYDKTGNYKNKIKENLKCKKCGKPVNTCSSCYYEHIHKCLQQEYPGIAEEFAVFFL